MRAAKRFAPCLLLGCTHDGVAPERLGQTCPSDAGAAPTVVDAGCVLQGFDPACAADPGPGKIRVTVSGESNALFGYPFPPSDPVNDTFMPDGWTFQVFEYIVVLDHVTLWANPNKSASDPSQHDAPVARLDGPFVVDLHKGGTLIGVGGAPEEAMPLGQILDQNANRHASFDPTQYYAFGFSTVAAACGAINVNLTADEMADYALMVERGYSVLYVGQAAWTGPSSGTMCTQTTAGTAPYDFSSLPSPIDFKLGFSTPTDYVNCQNESLGGPGIGGEDYKRGIQVSPSTSVIAQVTVHMDHPFWESFAENSPVHWDQIAAQYMGVTSPVATVEDMAGVPFYAFTDKSHQALPWRDCVGSFYAPPGSGQMAFSTLSVPVDPSAPCVPGNCTAIRDYYDFMRFTQSTQGHLNSQGLCFVDRQYPAPAGGS